MQVIITSPSLDPRKNVSGVSSVTQFIISNNSEHDFIHFEIGRVDGGRKGFNRITSNIKLLAKWIMLLKQYPGVTIHYNFPLEKLSILRDPIFMRVARMMGHKLVVHIHGGVFLTAPKIPFPFKQRLQRVLKWNVPFIVLSDLEREIMANKFGVKHIVTLPNCVDLRDAVSYTHRCIIENGTITIGYLGRITETKGMDYLLNACCKLKESKIPFKLMIAGTEDVKDSYLPQFKSSLGDQFEYMGLVSGEKKQQFLRSLDVLVMPTFFEGLPMSLLECMSYGIVPVITPVGSIPEVVRDNENGILIKLQDIDSIVEAIERLNTNSSLFSRLSNKAKETILSNFSPEKYISDLNKAYTSIH